MTAWRDIQGGSRRARALALAALSLVLALLSLALPAQAWAQEGLTADELAAMPEGVITFYNPEEANPAEAAAAPANQPVSSGTQPVGEDKSPAAEAPASPEAPTSTEAQPQEETKSQPEAAQPETEDEAHTSVAEPETQSPRSDESDPRQEPTSEANPEAKALPSHASSTTTSSQPSQAVTYTPSQASTSGDSTSSTKEASAQQASIAPLSTQDLTDDQLPSHEEATVLVRVAPGTTADQLQAILAQAKAAGLSLDSSSVTQADLTYGTVRLAITDGSPVTSAMTTLSSLGDVLAAQPNYLYKVSSLSTVDSIYNDPQSLQDWVIPSVHADKAWDMVRTQGAVGVAIIDTGVDETHPDLAANIVARHNATSSNYATTDYLGHGTHVAGLIAGVAGNGVGVAGTSYNAKLVIIKASPSNTNSFDSAAIVRSFAWLMSLDESGKTVAQHYNVRVVNMSIGGVDEDGTANQPDDEINAAMVRARDAGMLVVCAAGNKGSKDGPYATYPGDSDACLQVMNLMEAGSGDDEGDEGDEEDDSDDSGDEDESDDEEIAVQLSPTSNYNKPGTHYKDICAPGTFVRSTWTNGRYAYDSGTSMATPVVSGIAALLFAANPGLTPTAAMAILEGTATDLGDPGWDETYGYGEVNAEAAVRMALGARIDGPDLVGLGQGTGFEAWLDTAPLGADGWSWTIERDGGSAKAASWTATAGTDGATATAGDQEGGVSVVRGSSLGDVTLVASCKTAAGAEITVRKTVSVVSTAIAGSLQVAVGKATQLQGSLVKLATGEDEGSDDDGTDDSGADDGSSASTLRPGWHWEVHNLGDGGWATIDEEGVLTAVSTGTVSVSYVCNTNTSLRATATVRVTA